MNIQIKQSTNAQKIYNTETISKRHRHRYEINKEYISEFEKNGLIFSAESDGWKKNGDVRNTITQILSWSSIPSRI